MFESTTAKSAIVDPQIEETEDWNGDDKENDEKMVSDVIQKKELPRGKPCPQQLQH